MVRDRLKRLVSVAPHQILDRQDTKVRRGSPAPEPLPKFEDFVRQDGVRYKSRKAAIGDFGASFWENQKARTSAGSSSSKASSRASSRGSSRSSYGTVDSALAQGIAMSEASESYPSVPGTPSATLDAGARAT